MNANQPRQSAASAAPTPNGSTGPATAARRRGRFDTVVETNRELCREHYLLRLRVQGDFPPTQPGQFVQLGCRPPNGQVDLDVLEGRAIEWSPGERPALTQPELCGRLAMLRRPFSLSGRGDDERGTWVEVIHRVVGAGTSWLAELKPGDAVDLIGPLGNAFTLPDDKHIALLVGGGVGLPPMFYLAERLRREHWDAVAFVGAATRDLLAVTLDEDVEPNREGLPTLCVREFARFGFPTVVTTDDASLGLPGRITEGLKRLLADMPEASARRAVVYTCGPEPMMHAVATMAEARGIACQVCLEQAMACGMGTCQSCIVRIEEHGQPHGRTETGRPWRYRLACTDGPVFDSTQVVW